MKLVPRTAIVALGVATSYEDFSESGFVISLSIEPCFRSMAVLLSAAVPDAFSSSIVPLSSRIYLSSSSEILIVLSSPTVSVSPLSRFIPV